MSDLRLTYEKLPVILYLAISDTRARYARSGIGPFWPVLANAIGIVGLGALWTTLFGYPARTYVPSLAIGLVVWQLIAGCLTDSPGLVGRKAGIIRNLKFPLTFFPASLIASHLVNFAHSLLIILVLLVIFPQPVTLPLAVLSVAGLVLTLLNLGWIATLLAIVGARYRDVEPALTSAVPLLFLLSPVLFRADHVPQVAAIIWFNPVTWAITAIRDPLLGLWPGASVYVVMLATVVLGWTITLAVVSRFGRRVPFWI